MFSLLVMILYGYGNVHAGVIMKESSAYNKFADDLSLFIYLLQKLTSELGRLPKIDLGIFLRYAS